MPPKTFINQEMYEELLKGGSPAPDGPNLSLDVLMKPYYAAETETFVIPAGTSVSVALDGGIRFDHTLKNEHRFHKAHRRYEEASDDYYYRFATTHVKYPYMFVLKSLFGETPDAKTRALEIVKELPALTEKQIKCMRKKSKCPDCGHEYWLGGPCGGGSQNMKCKGCGSKFNVSPIHIERI